MTDGPTIESTSETRSDSPAVEIRACANPSCGRPFQPKRGAQVFCLDKCRQSYHRDHGTTGKVASVRRTKGGASLVIHLSGPAAESAIQLKLGELVRVTGAP
jgi:hypothetical protein